jgi:hypothetical protein
MSSQEQPQDPCPYHNQIERLVVAQPQDATVNSSFGSGRTPENRLIQSHFPRKRSTGERISKLPEKNIREYAKWIEEKRHDRTESEQKFLWKYQQRCLIQRDKLSAESLKDFIFRLLQKEERSPAENRLIRNFQCHRAARRLHRRGKKKGAAEVPQIAWKRNITKKQWANKAAQPSSSSALTLTSDMTTLREIMDKLEISSQKFRDDKMK